MDYFVKHLRASPRKFPSSTPIISVGDVHGKEVWIHDSFESCNFSIILKGSGEFHRKDRIWNVQAPCVITQWPGEPLDYGPHKTWDELYLIYDATCMIPFRLRGFVEESRPMWKIHNLVNVMTHVDELRALLRNPNLELFTDRVDSVCERLILETLLPEMETTDEVIQNIVLHLRQKLHESHDFDRLAHKHGMSPSTLRRRWFDAFQTSPGRYLLNLRIQKACRLLAETTLQVQQIAEQTGFEDMLYFSKRFKIETKLTPSSYRRLYRMKRS